MGISVSWDSAIRSLVVALWTKTLVQRHSALPWTCLNDRRNVTVRRLASVVHAFAFMLMRFFIVCSFAHIWRCSLPRHFCSLKKETSAMLLLRFGDHELPFERTSK